MSRRVGLRCMQSVGAGGCVIKISVLVDSSPSTKHAVVIDGKNYHNRNSFIISKGDHTLTWQSENGVVFSSWSVADNITVAAETAENTTLTIECGGTLTLNLLACPSGEQIINGDFETGDATGWTLTDGIVQSSVKHSGTYAAQIYPSGPRLLSQTLATPVPVNCIQTFGLWWFNGPASTVDIVYTDDTQTTYALGTVTEWTFKDLKTDLVAGKTIKRIDIHNGYVDHLYIDDVSLIC